MNYWISVLFRIIPLAMGTICLGYGWYIWAMGRVANPYVAGHVVFGLGLITCCVSTVALSSTKFILIPSNSKAGPGHHPDQAFSGGMVAL